MQVYVPGATLESTSCAVPLVRLPLKLPVPQSILAVVPPDTSDVKVHERSDRDVSLNVMVACDFFCKTVWTPMGKHVAYVLAFVHLGSRKVL